MYCPVCFNDTLKISSSGVVKFTFNGKAKATSQFFYNLSEDSEKDIQEKLEYVVKDYFVYYSGFQNQDTIENVEAYSIDFKCDNKCIINVAHKVNVIEILFDKKMLIEIVDRLGEKYGLETNLKLSDR